MSRKDANPPRFHVFNLGTLVGDDIFPGDAFICPNAVLFPYVVGGSDTTWSQCVIVKNNPLFVISRIDDDPNCDSNTSYSTITVYSISKGLLMMKLKLKGYP